MMTERMLVAAVQMNSGEMLGENLSLARQLVKEASEKGAQLVVLPEYFYLMGKTDEARLSLGEPFGDGPIQRFLSDLARENGIWLQCGTVPLSGPDKQHVFNSCLTFNPEGECVGRYDKIHLFGFQDSKDTYQESDTLSAGDVVTTLITPFGRLRPSICYDLRFPELFRTAPAPELITVPAAFTHTTGLAHWEVLLRARAIENQCYVIAAAQTGWHPNGRQTFGHSMIIDPWGKVLSVLPEGNGVVIAELDPSVLAEIRQKLPALQHRRLDKH
ncbi:carbon-nitrogen hydrolase family protein [Leeia speluncae]|nr:carbon-nitrogen hydrolase family protein [Leeia speluncae]